MPSVEGIPWSLDTMITSPLVGDEEQTCSRRLTRVVADAWWTTLSDSSACDEDTARCYHLLNTRRMVCRWQNKPVLVVVRRLFALLLSLQNKGMDCCDMISACWPDKIMSGLFVDTLFLCVGGPTAVIWFHFTICLVPLLFLSVLFLPAGPFFRTFPKKFFKYFSLKIGFFVLLLFSS